MEFTDKSKTVSQIFGGLGIAGSILEIFGGFGTSSEELRLVLIALGVSSLLLTLLAYYFVRMVCEMSENIYAIGVILEKGRAQGNASQAAAQAVPYTSEPPAPSVKAADGYWTCPKCGKRNERYSRVCNDCAYVR